MEQGKGAQRFFISETNPNDAIGGCGCLCGDTHVEDRGGPYAVFNHTATDSNSSPHVVVCAPCVAAVTDAIGGEAIIAGQVVEVLDAVEIVPPPEREPNPVADEWDIPAI